MTSLLAQISLCSIADSPPKGSFLKYVFFPTLIHPLFLMFFFTAPIQSHSLNPQSCPSFHDTSALSKENRRFKGALSYPTIFQCSTIFLAPSLAYIGWWVNKKKHALKIKNPSPLVRYCIEVQKCWMIYWLLKQASSRSSSEGIQSQSLSPECLDALLMSPLELGAEHAGLRERLSSSEAGSDENDGCFSALLSPESRDAWHYRPRTNKNFIDVFPFLALIFQEKLFFLGFPFSENIQMPLHSSSWLKAFFLKHWAHLQPQSSMGWTLTLLLPVTHSFSLQALSLEDDVLKIQPREPMHTAILSSLNERWQSIEEAQAMEKKMHESSKDVISDESLDTFSTAPNSPKSVTLSSCASFEDLLWDDFNDDLETPAEISPQEQIGSIPFSQGLLRKREALSPEREEKLLLEYFKKQSLKKRKTEPKQESLLCFSLKKLFSSTLKRTSSALKGSLNDECSSPLLLSPEGDSSLQIQGQCLPIGKLSGPEKPWAQCKSQKRVKKFSKRTRTLQSISRADTRTSKKPTPTFSKKIKPLSRIKSQAFLNVKTKFLLEKLSLEKECPVRDQPLTLSAPKIIRIYYEPDIALQKYCHQTAQFPLLRQNREHFPHWQTFLPAIIGAHSQWVCFLHWDLIPPELKQLMTLKRRQLSPSFASPIEFSLTEWDQPLFLPHSFNPSLTSLIWYSSKKCEISDARRWFGMNPALSGSLKNSQCYYSSKLFILLRVLYNRSNFFQ